MEEILGALSQIFENIFSNIALRPPTKARLNNAPMIKPFWQIVLQDACAVAVKDGFNKKTIVFDRQANGFFSSRLCESLN